jgi:hypothetical protein
MRLIEILLPLYDNDGRLFAHSKFNRIRDALARRFGGVTMFKRAPAEGLSKRGSAVTRDDIVIFEIMTGELDRRWWTQYRARLEKQFRQERVVVRASEIEVL